MGYLTLDDARVFVSSLRAAVACCCSEEVGGMCGVRGLGGWKAVVVVRRRRGRSFMMPFVLLWFMCSVISVVAAVERW